MYPLDQTILPELKEDDLDDLPPLAKAVSDGIGSFADKVIKAGKHKEAVQAYLATTTYVDTQIGRVLDALEKGPYKDIVVFLTDHGLHLGEKHHWQKTTLWEEGTHTLLMFRAPGVTKAGGVSERFVSLLDIYPTLAELCGLTPPAYIDGRSLVPLLKDPKAPWESTAITGLCTKGKQEGDAYISIRHELGRYTRYGAEEQEFYDTVQIRTMLTQENAKGQLRESIHGPQVDIGNSPGRSGHIFNQGNGAWITRQKDLTRNEVMVNVQWNRLRVLAVGPRIQTWINGKQVADVTDDESYAKYPSGVIALQVHGVKKSPETARHVSFRSIRVRRLDSAK